MILKPYQFPQHLLLIRIAELYGDILTVTIRKVKYLIHLQFYSEEEDVLFSRDKKHTLSIPGIAQVVAAFENEFQQHIHLIRKKEYRTFLDLIAKKNPL